MTSDVGMINLEKTHRRRNPHIQTQTHTINDRLTGSSIESHGNIKSHTLAHTLTQTLIHTLTYTFTLLPIDSFTHSLNRSLALPLTHLKLKYRKN